MTRFSPHEVPYRRRVSPLSAYGRLVAVLLATLVFSFAYLRFAFSRWLDGFIAMLTGEGRVYIPNPDEIIEHQAVATYSDGPLVPEFAEFLNDFLLSPYVAVPILVCGIVSVALIVCNRYRSTTLHVE